MLKFGVVVLLLMAGAAQAASEYLILSATQKENMATLINLNGKLCARVTQVRKYDDGDHYVECVTYRGGTATKAYYVNLKTGQARD